LKSLSGGVQTKNLLAGLRKTGRRRGAEHQSDFNASLDRGTSFKGRLKWTQAAAFPVGLHSATHGGSISFLGRALRIHILFWDQREWYMAPAEKTKLGWLLGRIRRNKKKVRGHGRTGMGGGEGQSAISLFFKRTVKPNGYNQHGQIFAEVYLTDQPTARHPNR